MAQSCKSLSAAARRLFLQDILTTGDDKCEQEQKKMFCVVVGLLFVHPWECM